MKKQIWISICAVMLFVFIVAGMFISRIGLPKNRKTNPRSEPGLYPLTSISEFFALDHAFVYFGKESCKECKLYTPILNEIITEQQLQIYYFDTNYFRTKTDTTEEELQRIFEEYQVLGVPMLLELKNGKLESIVQVGGFDKDSVVKVKDTTIKFLTTQAETTENTGFIKQYIPQYTVIFILFSVTLITLFIQFIHRKKIRSNTPLFTLAFFNIGLIFLVLISVSSTMNYLDEYKLSGDYLMGLLYVVSILLNLINIIFYLFRNLNQSIKKCNL